MAKRVTTIQINEDIFANNIKEASEIREILKKNNVLFINVMSSPGSGKTTLLTKLINELKNDYRILEMDVDIASDVDATKVSENSGISTIQINNGGLCHIDADMLKRVINTIDLTKYDIIFLENIGNLVCPAEFDVGANINMMLLSIPEGDDKPLKYPLMFKVSDIVVITKVDTLPIFNFDITKFESYVKKLNKNATIFKTSAKKDMGITHLRDWIISKYSDLREK